MTTQVEESQKGQGGGSRFQADFCRRSEGSPSGETIQFSPWHHVGDDVQLTGQKDISRQERVFPPRSDSRSVAEFQTLSKFYSQI